MLTRRDVLSLLAVTFAGANARLTAQSALFARKPRPHTQAPQPLVYFGTDTSRPGAKGIYAAHFDVVRGQFTQAALVAQTLGPTYLAVGGGHDRRLYAVNEGDAKSSGVSTFAMDATTGALKLLSQVPSAGASPCYLALSGSGRSAFVANYGGGTVTSFSVHPDGTLSQPVQSVDLRKGHPHGPIADRQDGSHPHSALLSPDERFLLVNDLGTDTIAVFPVDVQTAHLGPVRLTEVRGPGAGPRHLAFHPNGRWAYSIDELSSRIHQYLWNKVRATRDIAEQGLLTDTAHSISTLDAGYQGTNTAAELAISSDGYFVYASNRGEDSLAVFAVNQQSGALTLVQRVSCGGKTPRFFTLESSGRWVICCNLGTGSVTVFSRDTATGRLSGPVQTIAVPAVVFALFV